MKYTVRGGRPDGPPAAVRADGPRGLPRRVEICDRQESRKPCLLSIFGMGYCRSMGFWGLRYQKVTMRRMPSAWAPMGPHL